MRKLWRWLILLALCVPMHAMEWKLVWSDEFNGAEGSLPDAAKWTMAEGGSGYGNRELESYTARAENAHIEHGSLVLQTRRESYTGKDGIARDYTSARLETKGHFTAQYGRIEARIKLPAGGQGIWPAFWLLGDDYASVGWPACGEMDVMENVGAEPDTVHGSLHGPGYSGSNPLTGKYTLASGRFSDDYHLFAVEWEPDAVRFYVDDVLYETRTVKDIPPGGRWVFDHPFFVLLNVAVGGYWPGNPDQTTTLPTEMRVDYVRVYAKK